MNRALLVAALFLACAPPPEVTPPTSLVAAPSIPAAPFDADVPMKAVRWTLNYDLREFDTVWTWLHTLPKSATRDRAIAAAGLIAVAELDRDLFAETLTAFDDAIPSFPEDARLPLWRAYVRHLEARKAGNTAAVEASFNELRQTSTDYPGFTLFGLTLAIGGHADASPELLEEGLRAFEAVVADTERMQLLAHGSDLQRSRRLGDSPIAPFNIPAMQAMIGDFAVRLGRNDVAARAYYTATRSNFAYRWPWRAEVQRRLETLTSMKEGFENGTEWSIGSSGVSALGVNTARFDTRFGGRVGNGSCTVCHTHVSTLDEQGAPDVGWLKVKVKSPAGIPNLQPVAFALPDGKDPIPSGFAIGPYIDSEAGYDFDVNEALYTGEYFVPASAGRWFVAVQASSEGVDFQGYAAQGLGAQWFVDVKPGVVHDLTAAPIELTKLP